MSALEVVVVREAREEGGEPKCISAIRRERGRGSESRVGFSRQVGGDGTSQCGRILVRKGALPEEVWVLLEMLAALERC